MLVLHVEDAAHQACSYCRLVLGNLHEYMWIRSNEAHSSWGTRFIAMIAIFSSQAGNQALFKLYRPRRRNFHEIMHAMYVM